MLGYKGRTGRRDFFAGSALIVVMTVVAPMVIKPLMALVSPNLNVFQLVVVAVAVNLLAIGAVLAWFWGWTVLATRRARDAGLPAWVGVLSLVGLAATGAAISHLPPALEALLDWLLALGWIITAGAPPSKAVNHDDVAPPSQAPLAICGASVETKTPAPATGAGVLLSMRQAVRPERRGPCRRRP